ncbi:MAG: DUF309 domain-containing protein [Holophagaceae bacterium]|nr:DUF309 domain-containing protein [Holophagaceae bacterium]
MSCDSSRPIFFQRQPVLPLPVQRFLRMRLEAALEDPNDRALLAWPTVLGAPKLRQEYPSGMPEQVMFSHAAKMLHALGIDDPEASWMDGNLRFPETAEQGDTGLKPHGEWGAFGPLVSLRSGVALSALTELPSDGTYELKAGLALFNSALYHEAHDALERLWKDAAGGLREGLQALILMTAGYHHLQLHNLGGMQAVWQESLHRLGALDSLLDTPWGKVDHRGAVACTQERMANISSGAVAFERLWAMPVPRWEIS